MRVDYLGLEAFVRIADHGSFQRAAEALNLSQTALSHRLRKVEADLGLALLVRSSREVSLTPAGQQLLPDARRLLKDLAESYAAVRRRGRASGRRLTFACVPTIAHALMPPILHAFAARHEDASITLDDAPVAHIADRVQTTEAEFGVTVVSAQLQDLQVRELFEEPYVLLVPRDHPLAAQESVQRADLAGVTMARISTQSRNRQLVDDALDEAGERARWRFEVQNAAMAVRMVADGAAVTILPRSAGDVLPAGVVMREFADIRPTRTIGIIRRRAVPLSDLGAELMAEIETALGRRGEGRQEGVRRAAMHPTPRD